MSDAIDAEVYMRQLLDQSFAALDPQPVPMPNVRPDIDVQSLDGLLPLFAWNLTGGGDTVDGLGLWSFTLHTNFFGNGMDEAKAIMRTGHGVIHSWNDDPWSSVIVVDGIRINVLSVEDVDLPSRFPSADIPGRNVVQYSGSYALLLRSI